MYLVSVHMLKSALILRSSADGWWRTWAEWWRVVIGDSTPKGRPKSSKLASTGPKILEYITLDSVEFRLAGKFALITTGPRYFLWLNPETRALPVKLALGAMYLYLMDTSMQLYDPQSSSLHLIA